MVIIQIHYTNIKYDLEFVTCHTITKHNHYSPQTHTHYKSPYYLYRAGSHRCEKFQQYAKLHNNLNKSEK